MTDQLDDARLECIKQKLAHHRRFDRQAYLDDVPDLMAALTRLRAERLTLVNAAVVLTEKLEAAEAARDDAQHRLDLFKNQLSVQEERTGSWHQAYDALHAQLEAAEEHLEIKEAAIQHLGQQLSLRQRDHAEPQS